jgi:hypothetical protein
MNVGMAHLRWGPLCHPKGNALDSEVVTTAATAIYDEYVVKRGLFLRVLPKAYGSTPRSDIFASAFSQYRGGRFGNGESYRTIDLDLTPPLQILRKNLDQKWRNQLNQAERNALAIIEDDGVAWFARFAELLDEMEERKRFKSASDIREFEQIQHALPSDQRMRVLICQKDGIVHGSLIASSMGSSGIYLFGATTEHGRRSKSAYLLQWSMIRRLKERGFTSYDLGGINPERNPGVYHFKRGLGGNDNLYATPVVACESAASRMFYGAATLAGGRVRAALKRAVYGSRDQVSRTSTALPK